MRGLGTKRLIELMAAVLALAFTMYFLSWSVWVGHCKRKHKPRSDDIRRHHNEYQQLHEVNLTASTSESVADHVPLTFRVALVGAGELRSFAFAAESWKRYIFDPWKGHVYLFAHVVDNFECPLAVKGMSLLKQYATEIEVSPATPIISGEEVRRRVPIIFGETKWYLNSTAVNMTKGNFVDMNTRRSRAHDLAKRYAQHKGIVWDLVVHLRFDSAIYSPVWSFFNWYTAIKSHNEQYGARSIYVPRGCKFQGICDRIAVGLPSEMETYFQADWTFKALQYLSEGSISIVVDMREYM